VICHGIPSDSKVVKNGDALSIDITVIKDGYFGDTSRMFIVGEGSILAKRLVQTTYECMWLGIDQVKPGARLGDIGHAIQKHAEAQGYSVVREYCGHGIFSFLTNRRSALSLLSSEMPMISKPFGCNFL